MDGEYGFPEVYESRSGREWVIRRQTPDGWSDFLSTDGLWGSQHSTPQFCYWNWMALSFRTREDAELALMELLLTGEHRVEGR